MTMFHPEVDGVSRLDEVEGPQVRIESFKSFTNLKTDLETLIEAIYLQKVMKNIGYRLTLACHNHRLCRHRQL